MTLKNTFHIVHVTTVHPRYDNRIFHKECTSLRRAGFNVSLVVADGIGQTERNGISIYDIGKPENRLKRVTIATGQAFRKALALKPDIIHIHDAELLPAALLFKMLGLRVVYDSHEDLPRSLMSRAWIHRRVKKQFAAVAEFIEDFVAKRMTAIVAATPIIAERFRRLSPRVEVVCNFPVMTGSSIYSRHRREPRTVCYVGGISKHRGIEEILAAVHKANVKLLLAGPFTSESYHEQLQQHIGWKNVEYLGIVPLEKVRDILERSQVGLVILHPVQNYIDSIPTKLFEYMEAELPVVASDYTGWPDIVRDEKIGLVCPPLDPSAIATAISTLVENPSVAEQMGKRGRKIALEKYRWENEAEKLVYLYDQLSSVARNSQ